MPNQNKSIRTCIVCKKKTEKPLLLRLVRINGELIIDENQKINSRAVYLCKDINCALKLKKQKGLNRIYHCQIDDNDYDKIIQFLK